MNNQISDSKINIARWCLRLGLAFVFLYAAYEVHFDPDNFLKYVPIFVQNIIPINLFLTSFTALEISLALWFLAGKRTGYAGLLSFFIMLSIIFPNLVYFNILFRNVAIAMAGLALFYLD